MTFTKFYTKTFKAITIITLCTGCGLSYGEKITAKNSTLASINFEPPPPPPGRAPTGRLGGGGRRGCDPTALVPLTKSNNGDLLWGLTVSERPQFWFSLPRKLTTKDAVEFVLKDNQGKEIYKTTLKNSETPHGVISFAVPSKTPPLEIGKSYSWSFSLYCDYETVEDKPGTVQGAIQRIAVNTTLKNQLANAKNSVDQASIYAKNGIWFDAITTLGVNIRDKKEKDASSAWTELLRQVNLEKAAPLPVTNCCNQ
jgi:Domain of Unknown Function (DUF928)